MCIACSERDLNPRPLPCKGTALTELSYRSICVAYPHLDLNQGPPLYQRDTLTGLSYKGLLYCVSSPRFELGPKAS